MESRSNNSRSLWFFVRERLNGGKVESNKFTGKIKIDNKIIKNPKELAEAFNNFFVVCFCLILRLALT